MGFYFYLSLDSRGIFQGMLGYMCACNLAHAALMSAEA